jgi:hypothetical protein
MAAPAPVLKEETAKPRRSRVVRALLIVSLVFAAIIGGIVITAMVSGERRGLEFDYEGFD